eukprot:CAMPEP_0172511766 /NCGR_PEP_ID=MMETSP1066-20121228/238806_1 /TAXON_ID=671091 /ORGANISM="Coscinodiscus wailesii, Strain CCMP2513" /LENGTH=124 /DNA_ID=CAMNT_0013291287 /DNA_START=129 /DNA_END=500 /DNA_ORIENTATION=+
MGETTKSKTTGPNFLSSHAGKMIRGSICELTEVTDSAPIGLRRSKSVLERQTMHRKTSFAAQFQLKGGSGSHNISNDFELQPKVSNAQWDRKGHAKTAITGDISRNASKPRPNASAAGFNPLTL